MSYDELATLSRPTLGLYYWDPAIDTPCIVLDRHLHQHPRLLKCVLAEELGHYHTVPRGNLLLPFFSYSNTLRLSKDERKALKWACDFLIPDLQLCALIRQESTLEEIADHFEVTKWLLKKKFQFLKETLT
ncbi:MAG: ImmA/IrrE family metallo-endopeptidase [Alicyclobacillus sp.]|nr:ImmA/IrrE family metallo-endopeptidase [Alicyclobacillus sp.]